MDTNGYPTKGGMMSAPAYQLVLRSGPTPGTVFSLEKANMFIGRDLGNDIVINDAEVSRRHARLVMQGDSYVIEDLGSTNGTSVNGQRLTGPRLLKSGDAVTFGEKLNLAFEQVLTSPEATVMAPRQAVPQAVVSPIPPPAVQPRVQPAVQPARPPVSVPPPAYAGYVPAGPPPAAQKKKFPVWVIILIVVVLVLICACAVTLWYIDTNFLWCKILPFLPGCQ
jgi:hypothetical protein